MFVSSRSKKGGTIEIYPKFICKRCKDLMIRGGDFYAIWDEERSFWCTEEDRAIELIDAEIDTYWEKHKDSYGDSRVIVLHLWDAETGMIDVWHKYCQKQLRDSFHQLDEKLIFSNEECKKEDYCSKRLSYPLQDLPCPGYNKLIGTLYTESERHKLEWAIGAIVNGDSRWIQKFLVLYGSAGAGKSTILNIIQMLFEGYYCVFNAKALGSSSNSFALEAFKSNPLVAIEHDGDLSKIEDNTRLNSLVSHELMTVNEKFKSAYSNSFKAFLFMGTNKPVKITDAKSGLIRRLIDVTPSGEKLPVGEYNRIMNNIEFELSGIAYHCKQVYESNPNYYDSYVPINMLGATNDFYNFILDSFPVFSKEDSTTLRCAWEMYKKYCEDCNVPYPLSQRVFKEELKNYFEYFNERERSEEGTRVRNLYSGFKRSIFIQGDEQQTEENKYEGYVIEFRDDIESIFDKEFCDCKAQDCYNELPRYKWDNVTTVLSDIDTKALHYVKVPLNHIVIDFDIQDETGEKSFELNLKEASKFPPTYAELSKSGKGIHLHYNYVGDVTKLARLYNEKIEIKIFNGNSSLRRKLTKCNNLPISTISSGLPLKEVESKMISKKIITSERGIRTLIEKNLRKEYHAGTKPSIDFIYKILEDAYNTEDFCYDVSDMKGNIAIFASNSTHQAQYCLEKVRDMKFKSKQASNEKLQDLLDKNPEDILGTYDHIVFFDIEIFPNLFLVNWKKKGPKYKVVRMINPKPESIEELIKYKLVGFNNRSYDNHMLYACMMGYSVEELYDLSCRIISGDRNAKFGEAYNLSYTDVYDFASGGNKKSLKKWELQLGVKHHELGFDWNQPVPESKWEEVAEYCDDDVIATEVVFDHLQDDFVARKILSTMCNGSVNDTTNTLTTKIVFGNNRKPQDEFNYRDISKPVYYPEELMWTEKENPNNFFKGDIPFDTATNHISLSMYNFIKENNLLDMEFTAWNGEKSILPFFPGYTFENGKSKYRGIEVGEGGYVYAEHGIHNNVALLDVASMHPTSTIAECLFGPKYTKRYMELKNARIAIKHDAMDDLKNMLDGILYDVVSAGSYSMSMLSTALKTPINSTYGLTDAAFINPFRDVRNIDNIVAKRGALFMIDLVNAVQERGFTVAHIKTDSIKIPDATPEIIDFVMEFGKKYGYTFEHEATYSNMCLVNNAVYIAKYQDCDWCKKHYGYVPGDNKKAEKKGKKWTATGTQFAVPYVFKSLFSKEPIDISDMTEIKSVTTAMYLNMDKNKTNEELKKEELQFIGKVGGVTPVDKSIGGVLVRESKDKNGNIKYGAVGGTKGYYWLETQKIKELGLEDRIDRSYYERLCDEAIKAINKYGDFNVFVD